MHAGVARTAALQQGAVFTVAEAAYKSVHASMLIEGRRAAAVGQQRLEHARVVCARMHVFVCVCMCAYARVCLYLCV
jgi:hypothetical protein